MSLIVVVLMVGGFIMLFLAFIGLIFGRTDGKIFKKCPALGIARIFIFLTGLSLIPVLSPQLFESNNQPTVEIEQSVISD